MRWCSLVLLGAIAAAHSPYPAVVNTWGGPMVQAAAKAWEVLAAGGTALDAVEKGCSECEDRQCDGSVGFGGSQDENGETTLDALIMDGETMETGAVCGLRRIKNAIGVARKVLEQTTHSLLSGELATEFAVMMGFRQESLRTNSSVRSQMDWLTNNCQPNYRINVSPDPRTSCGPYTPVAATPGVANSHRVDQTSHDTISMIALSHDGKIASGTSTNGARFKVPGRVGDGPIAGSGSYSDGEVGGCGATGDGDILMRFLPCYQVVEYMRGGMSPTLACESALRKILPRILPRYPSFKAGLVAMNKQGEHGGAGFGWGYGYSVRTPGMDQVEVVSVRPIPPPPFNRTKA